MKLIILLAVAALSSGAKLDRTYLPPSYAQTSGGNGQFLEAPETGFQNYQNNDFTQASSSSFGQNDAQNYPNDAQNANGLAQDVNSFAQNNDFGLNPFNAFDNPERPQAAAERSAEILRLDNQNDGETYAYAYETSNGISAEENGVAVDGVKAQGGYSYTGDDGQVYSVRYTADENGFVPVGDHLPTPPPIPEEILKALEQNAQDEANGVFDDGSYSEGKYDDQNGQQGGEAGYNYNNNNGNQFNAGGNYNNNFNNGNSNNGNTFDVGNTDDDDTVVTTNALLRSNDAAQSNFGQQNARSTFGSQNQNAVEKAYLPPFQQSAQRPQANTVARFQPKKNGFRNQASGKQNGVQRAYLPPQQFGQNAQRSQPRYTPAQNNGFRNANNGFNNQNAVERTYLPPQQSGQSQRPQANVDARFTTAQSTGFTNQANDEYSTQNGVQREYLPPQRSTPRSQAPSRNGNGVERSYLPPGQFGQRSQNRGRAPQANGFRNQSNGVERSYLPPSQQDQTIKNKGFQSLGMTRRNGVNREYLPPTDQRRNGFLKNAVFDANRDQSF